MKDVQEWMREEQEKVEAAYALIAIDILSGVSVAVADRHEFVPHVKQRRDVAHQRLDEALLKLITPQ